MSLKDRLKILRQHELNEESKKEQESVEIAQNEVHKRQLLEDANKRKLELFRPILEEVNAGYYNIKGIVTVDARITLNCSQSENSGYRVSIWLSSWNDLIVVEVGNVVIHPDNPLTLSDDWRSMVEDLIFQGLERNRGYWKNEPRDWA